MTAPRWGQGPHTGRPWRDFAFGAALFAVAMALRVEAAFRWGREPVWDGHYYDFGAHRIAEGFGYSDSLTVGERLVWHPWCHYPVGYSAFLALFYRIFGPSPGVASFADALTGAALALVTWQLARHALSPLRAKAAGIIVALHPGLVLYAALEMSEPLAALVTLAGFWVAVHDTNPRRGLVLGALVLGVAALVRPQALLCAPFLALVLPARSGAAAAERALQIAKAGAAALVISIVPVLPWTARNCLVMDGCALVSTNGGWNLAIGAFPRATGRFETLRSSDGCREVTGQVQQDRCWFAYGLREIELHPGHWLGLIPVKLGFTFDHESFEVEYLHESRPEIWPEPFRVAVRGWTTLVERVLVCAAALGVVALRPRGKGARLQGALALAWLVLVYVACMGEPMFWPLVLFACVVPWLHLPGSASFRPALLLPVALLATTALTHAVFFGEDRYHMVVVPVFAMLAAGALRAGDTRAAPSDTLPHGR